MIDKSLLLNYIIEKLDALLMVANNAAMQAYDTATHEENVAENKYDTLGLEASYLAQGQAQRVTECELDLAEYKGMSAIWFTPDTPIDVGALVCLMDDRGTKQYFFVGPAAGGLKFCFSQIEIMVITRQSPLGAALLGHCVGDEIELKLTREVKSYEVSSVH